MHDEYFNYILLIIEKKTSTEGSCFKLSNELSRSHKSRACAGIYKAAGLDTGF